MWCLQHTLMCCHPLLQISCNRGLISPAQRDRVFSVMRALQLPMKHEVCNTKLYMKVRIWSCAMFVICKGSEMVLLHGGISCRQPSPIGLLLSVHAA